MEADDRPPRPLVDVVKPQAVDLAVVGGEAVAGEAFEALVGGAEDVHRARRICGFALRSRPFVPLHCPPSWLPSPSLNRVPAACLRRRTIPPTRRCAGGRASGSPPTASGAAAYPGAGAATRCCPT